IVLETLGIEITETDDNYLDLIEKKFGSGFPKTDVFSAFARATLPEISSLDNPDEAFIAWIDREEMLFRTLERRLVSERLREGFVKGGHIDVDGFVILALKIINRRKARAGLALEHHLEYIFQEHHILYSRGKTTENKSKPDFIFPNIEEYHDVAFPQSRLTMLGVKSTCKDRWRQVLTEAERIKKKHLFTLETGISLNQTKEMQSHNLQLVLPKGLHKTYKAEQIAWLLNLQDFLELVKARQTPKH
ncbi:MAG: restriction endonuclease, partial [Chloroflexi bacterium]|nr:restriction endonuclease [Chloroflexota bacterium]